MLVHVILNTLDDLVKWSDAAFHDGPAHTAAMSMTLMIARDVIAVLLVFSLLSGVSAAFYCLVTDGSRTSPLETAQKRVDDLTEYIAALSRRATSTASALDWYRRMSEETAQQIATQTAALTEAQLVLTVLRTQIAHKDVPVKKKGVGQ